MFVRDNGLWPLVVLLATRDGKLLIIGARLRSMDYGDAYKLVFCPSVVQSFKHMCKDVGVFVDENGNKRLALSDVPLKVKFQQAWWKLLKIMH